jgi:hypothetical protein
MLSYFGTDQSQVQRYLTARSVDEARSSLFISAYWKIPLQALVLLVGMLVFVYYLFSPPPLLYNTEHDDRRTAAAGQEYAALEAATTTPSRPAAPAAVDLATARSTGDRALADRMVAEFLRENERVEDVRSDALELAAAPPAEPARRQLHHPRLRPRRAAHHHPRPLHRRRPGRRHVVHLQRAELPLHRHHHRLLPATLPHRRHRLPLPHGLQARHRPGGSSPAAWPSTPWRSAPSSRS